MRSEPESRAKSTGHTRGNAIAKKWEQRRLGSPSMPPSVRGVTPPPPLLSHAVGERSEAARQGERQAPIKALAILCREST